MICCNHSRPVIVIKSKDMKKGTFKFVKPVVAAAAVVVLIAVSMAVFFEVRFRSGLDSPILFGEANQFSDGYTSEKLSCDTSDNNNIKLSGAYLISDPAANQVRFRFTSGWFKDYELFSATDFSITSSDGQILTQNAGVNCPSILGRDCIDMTISLSPQELLSLRSGTLNVRLSLRENRLQSDTEFAGCSVAIQIPNK